MNRQGNRGALISAVLWTVVAVIWIVQVALRFSSPHQDEGTLVLHSITALASLVACVCFWLRYVRTRKKEN